MFLILELPNGPGRYNVRYKSVIVASFVTLDAALFFMETLS